MKSIHWLTILSLALTLCFGCSRNPDSSAPLSQPPSHGTAFLLQYDPAEVQGDSNALQNLEEAVNKRLSKLGISTYWETASSNEVRILTSITQQSQIAGVENALAQRGMLEFRLVKEDSDDLIKQGQSAPGYELMKMTNVVTRPSKTMEDLVKKEPVLKPVLTNKLVQNSGMFVTQSSNVTAYLVKMQPELTGRYVQKAWVQTNRFGLPEINFQLDQHGAELFQTITSNNVGRQLAIVLDGRIYYAPMIRAPIPGGRAMIAGNFTPKEAQELADVLDCPLPFPIKMTVEKTY